MALKHSLSRSASTRTAAILAAVVWSVGAPGAALARADQPALTYYGAAGSFGTVASRSAGGTPVATRAVRGWGFLPGQAAYFTAIADDGTVLMANEPQTDNQFLPTADQMVVSAFTPSADRFENVVIPTTTGRTRTARDGVGEVGGGDVSDIGIVPTPTGSRVAFLSTAPYANWDLEADGQYPTLGYLSQVDDRWVPDASRSRTASQLASTNGPDGPCRMTINSRWQPTADCHAVTEMAVLPRSGHLAVTQYVPAAGDSRTSGDLLVMDAAGRAQARYAYPDVTLKDGTRVGVYPREIDADPTSSGGDERFVVVFDAVVGAGSTRQHLVPFAAQEFSYDVNAGTIAPTSLPVLSGQAADGDPLGFETAQFDPAGRLWLAQAVNGTFRGGGLAVYEPRPGGGALSGPGCAAAPGWYGEGWGTSCPPSATISAASGLGIVRSLTVHARGVLAATMSGYLLAVSSVGGHYRAGPALDLGLEDLVDRRTAWVGPRKGSVDPATDDLWLPIQQLRTTASCPAQPCRPVALDQWLTRVDAGRLLAAAAAPASAAAAALALPTVAPVAAPSPPATFPAGAGDHPPLAPARPTASPPSTSTLPRAPGLRFARELAVATLSSGRAAAEITCHVQCVVHAELRASGRSRHVLGRARASGGASALRLRLRATSGARSWLSRTRPSRAELVVWITRSAGADQRLEATTRIRHGARGAR